MLNGFDILFYLDDYFVLIMPKIEVISEFVRHIA